MGVALIVVYLIWSFYSGWKVMTGRSEWLDRNIIVKILVSAVVGVFVGVFYFLFLAIKLMFWIGQQF